MSTNPRLFMTGSGERRIIERLNSLERQVRNIAPFIPAAQAASGSTALGGDLSGSLTAAVVVTWGGQTKSQVVAANLPALGGDLTGSLTAGTVVTWGGQTKSQVVAANIPASVQQARVSLAYSASITPNAGAGAWQTITVTNATAFAILAPTSPPDSAHHAELTIEVLNSSGGAMGAITWNAAFVFAGQTWVNPASTKRRFARFEWNGSNWICTAISPADY